MAKQSPKQREVVGRVMREFKHGELDSSSGRKVKNPRQAIAIALHEAGASRDETPAANRRNLARTERKERAGGAKRIGGGQTCAELYAEATERSIAGRSRMTKAELSRALGRG